MGPRELFYADIFASRQTRLPLAARPAGHPRPARRLRRRATSSSTTSSTSCCSRCPTTTPTRTATARTRRSTSIAAADRQLERLMHAGGGPGRVPRRARGDRLLGPLARPGRAAIDLSRRSTASSVELPAPARVRRDGEPPRSRCARRSARRWSTCSTASAAPSSLPRIVRTALELEGVDLVMPWPPPRRRGGDRAARRGELRFAPGGDLPDQRGERWSVEGDLDAARPAGARRRARLATLPRRARARVVGAALPRRPATCCSRPRPATSSSTGAASTTSAAARTARCTPTTRSARCCGAARAPTAPTRGRSGRSRHRADGARALRRARRVRAALARARSCWRSSPRRGGADRALARALRRARRPAGERAPADVHARGRRARRRCAARAPGRDADLRPRLLQEQGRRRWQVSFFAPPRAAGERTRRSPSRRRRPQRARARGWTGPQVAWTMARGYAGAFGRTSTRCGSGSRCARCSCCRSRARRCGCCTSTCRAARVLGLLRVLQRARIDVSVPLVYPLLVYLLARMLGIAPAARGREPPPLRLPVPGGWLAIGAVFLLGFRFGLNVVDSNVIDVGYAGVIGADRFGPRRRALRQLPERQRARRHLRAGHLLRLRAVRAAAAVERRLGRPAGRARRGDRLRPAAVGGLFLLGRRMRGPTLGALLAYAWAAFPFTLSCELERQRRARRAARAAALLALARPVARGAAIALGGADEVRAARAGAAVRDVPAPSRARASALAAAGFAALAALALAPVALGDGLGTFYDRTLGFQADRGSPFSIWGLYDWPGRCSVALAAALVARRGRRLRPAPARRVTLAALGAAVLIALQLGADALVLPLRRLVPAARARGAARRAQDRLDRLRARRRASRRERCG